MNWRYFRFSLDGAHTLDSMQVCSDWFRSNTRNNEKVLIFNVTGERQPNSLLELLQNCRFSTAIFIPNVGDDHDNSGEWKLKLKNYYLYLRS